MGKVVGPRVCSKCGKLLKYCMDPSKYVYKIKQKDKPILWYCSYTCWSKARREKGLD